MYFKQICAGKQFCYKLKLCFRFRKSTSETRKSKRWAEDNINDALKEIHENGTLIYEIGKRYGIPELTLRKRRDILKEGIPLVGSGS